MKPRGIYRELEPLESRRLLSDDPNSFDLAMTNISSVAPFTKPGGELHFSATHLNFGQAQFQGTTKISFAISADNKFGNADDIQIGHTDGPTFVSEDHVSEEEDYQGILPADVAPGSYYLAVTIQKLTGGVGGSGNDTDPTNNTFISPSAYIVVTDKVWPSTTILGTAGNDRIAVCTNGDAFVSLNGDVRRLPNNQSQLYIDGGAGNDRIGATDDLMAETMLVTGSGGNDTIVGGAFNDSISGGNGKDRISGGGGDDDILGGAANDSIYGGIGDDLLRGAGGNDRLIDTIGVDYLIGGAGNDVLVSRDDQFLGSDTANLADSLSGGAGKDSAQLDDVDGRAGIETILA